MADKPETSYRILGHCETPAFTLGDYNFDARLEVPSHSHDEPHLTLILSGGCDETYLGKVQQLSPLNVTYFHPGETHVLRIVSQPYRSFDLSFNHSWLSQFSLYTVAPDTLLRRQSASIVPLLTCLYKEFRERDNLSPLVMEGLALVILAELVRASRHDKNFNAPRWLRRVVERLHDEFAGPITLTGLAHEVGVHPSHLTEVFRAHHKCTPGEYLRRIRVERAMQLMVASDTSLADIAVAVGFSDQSHFSRVFKQITGQTPARFRRLKFFR